MVSGDCQTAVAVHFFSPREIPQFPLTLTTHHVRSFDPTILRSHETGGTRSSGGTKFDRNSRSCGVRLDSPDALILSRMRFTSSRFSAWMLARLTLRQL